MLPGKTCGVMIPWGKECGRVKKRKQCVTAPITLPRLDAATLTKLRQRYEDTPKVESRTGYQSLTCLGLRHRVGAIQRKVPIPAHQCAHAIFPSLLKRVSLPLTRVGDLVEMTIMIGDDHMTQSVGSVIRCDISHIG